jgi:hypothetical protein
MDDESTFQDLTVLGAMDPGEAAKVLHAIGENDAADRLERTAGGDLRSSFRGVMRWPFQDRPWQYTAHAFGHVSTTGALDTRPIHFAGNIEPDKSLIGVPIKVTLDRLRVADYPGGSTHTILFDFYARNQTADKIQEPLHFNSLFRAKEGQEAAVIGYPVFIGLNVGGDGLSFRCLTINVKNDADENLLNFLESDVFKAGMRLSGTVQPVIAPFSEMVVGLTKAVARRNRNVPVQEFYMGLDFSSVATRARLSEGSYIAVQIPDTLHRIWDWTEWVYNVPTGQIVAARDNSTLIPFNYIVFGVSRYSQ